MRHQLTDEHLIQAGLDKTVAATTAQRINRLLSSLPADECWSKLSKEILTPRHPFALHTLLYQTVFADWDKAKGPAPAWFPTDEESEATNIAKLMRTLNLSAYEQLHAWSIENRAHFWKLMIRKLGIRFQRDFTKTVDLSAGVTSPRWLVDAALNIVDSCFHAPDEVTAIIFQSEGGSISTWSYKQLRLLTNRVANGLVDAGLEPGDAIAVDMPMTAESVSIYLGIIKAGGVVVSIADSFAPREIEMRLRIANAKAIFTQADMRRGGKQLPLYAKIVAANAPRAIVLPGRNGYTTELRAGDLTWDRFLSDGKAFHSAICHPHDYTNILFSSGTTGEPKAIPWTQTTPIKCAADGHLHHDIQPGDVVAWPTNLGWMMGPWLIYASLINRATMALYDGAPTGRAFGEFVQNAGVTVLGVVPSLVRAWKNSECMAGLDWQAIRAFSSTGEASNAEDMLFLMSLAGYRPIIEYCGGTEIGGAYVTGTLVQPAAPTAFTTPALGLDLVILDENGQPTDNGEVFLVPPSIGLSTVLVNGDHHQAYFDGVPALPNTVPLRRHGDQIERLKGGGYCIHGRADDTMNLNGIKVSSAEIERILSGVSGVRETAAIAVSLPEGGPSQLVIYAVLLPEGHVSIEALKAAFQTAIREQLNPLFKVHDVVVVDALPRTASNKVMRRVLRERHTV